MKTVILAGGLGTRLSEETAQRPKPMVEIGGRPILWHVMSIYARHGYREFVIACGYRGEVIKQYFHDYSIHAADWQIDLQSGARTQLNQQAPDWRIHAVDTGLHTLTGGRLQRLRQTLQDETFMVTYGDGLSDIDIARLVAFHRAHGKIATVTAVHPPARFGSMELDDGRVTRFSEKPQTAVGWINGGFFVFEPGVLDYLDGDATSLEREPLERLAAAGELMAYRHEGFWQPMDTLREKRQLEELWESGHAPWTASSD
ncbi:MAG: glucose-1-phosphate cytidylyltransferase [Gemmatimonadales bacterium]|nr:glucose-1-phosphate cytidylyltransferase [Gemmatimonadales bacterium]